MYTCTYIYIYIYAVLCSICLSVCLGILLSVYLWIHEYIQLINLLYTVKNLLSETGKKLQNLMKICITLNICK